MGHNPIRAVSHGVQDWGSASKVLGSGGIEAIGDLNGLLVLHALPTTLSLFCREKIDDLFEMFKLLSWQCLLLLPCLFAFMFVIAIVFTYSYLYLLPFIKSTIYLCLSLLYFLFFIFILFAVSNYIA